MESKPNNTTSYLFILFRKPNASVLHASAVMVMGEGREGEGDMGKAATQRRPNVTYYSMRASVQCLLSDFPLVTLLHSTLSKVIGSEYYH